VLHGRVTGPRGSQIPHIHRQYGHVWLLRTSLGGVSLSPHRIRRICRFAPETHRKRITAVSPASTDRNPTNVRLFFFFRYAVLLQDVEDYVLLHAWVFTKIFT
jgi:hypothetical protein